MRTLKYKGKRIPYKVWEGEKLGRLYGLDTETAMIQGQEVPELALGSAYDGKMAYVIMDMKGFLEVNQQGHRVIFHSAPFDIAVTEKAVDAKWYDMVDKGEVLDIAVLYRLWKLATKGEVPFKYSLDLISLELLHIKLDKNEMIRCTFDGELSEAHLEYAALDAVATYEAGLILIEEAKKVMSEHGTGGMLGHRLQLQADIVLSAMERQPLHVDMARARTTKKEVERLMMKEAMVLANHSYYVTRTGLKKVYNRIIEPIAEEYGVHLPQTEAGDYSSKGNYLEPMASHPFVSAFLEYSRLQKLHSTFLKPLTACGGVVHPRYSLLKNTGRTGCSKPNVQQQPREGGVRECIVPAPGHVFIGADYSFIELCTLAQVMYEKFGKSLLRNVINSGEDPHYATASLLLNKSVKNVTKDERQKAKVFNFGIPGGMRAPALAHSAKYSYGVEISELEAEEWRDKFLNVYRDIDGYLNCHWKDVSFPSGRVAVDLSSNQAHNFPFQGRAADGIKRAMWKLHRANWTPSVMVHDELIMQAKKDVDLLERCEYLERVMVENMNYYCPDVLVQAESVVSALWLKGADGVDVPKGTIVTEEMMQS